MILDAVPLVHTYQLPPSAGWEKNLDLHRLAGWIDDAPCFRDRIPAIENLTPAAVCGDAQIFRVRRNSQPELWVMVQLRTDAHELVRALRQRGPGPGTLTGVVENGVLTAVSVNAGEFRALAAYGGI